MLLGSTLRAAVPLLLAALGEACAERAGLLNLGVEGMMLAGAFVGFYVSFTTGNPVAAIAAGLFVGTSLALVFGVLTITLRVNQIVVGLGMTVFGSGLTAFLFRLIFGARFPMLDHGLDAVVIPGLHRLPLVGSALFAQHGMVYLSLALVPLLGFVMSRTTFGLAVRAVGEHPFAADAAGVDVVRVRYAAMALGGALAGLGGAYLAVGDLKLFVPGMTQGQGFIAIAIAMLGRSPGRVLVGALLFGMMHAAANALQIVGVPVSAEFILMLPYLGVIGALVVLARHAALPAALGLPYERGHR